MKIYEFSENNSGGSWWLERRHYDALFAAGWTYEPTDFDKERGYDTKPLFEGEKSEVPYGWRHSLRVEAETIQDAVKSWEKATGQDFFAQGCACCGVPFSISSTPDSEGEWEYISGSDAQQIQRPF